ncbi:MAG: SH3 domain-containing protein [Spirochaetia bacterium]|nr:SH3 domain-containing protein [Spirochaetia bacterium]
MKKLLLFSIYLAASLSYFGCDLFLDERNVLALVNETELNQNFDVKHFKIEDECSYISISYYLRENKIKKIFYSYSEGCARENDISLIQYFDFKGNPLKVSFYSSHHSDSDEDKKYCYSGRGNANFLNRDVERSCAELSLQSGQLRILKKFLPPCAENISNLKQLFIQNQFCYFKNEASAKQILDYEMNSKKNRVSSLDYFAKHSFINSIQVNMRKEPRQDSESLGHLYPLEEVKVLEEGQEDEIQGIGKNRWVKIQVKSYAYLGGGSFYREETEGWIFGTFLHRYKEGK